MQSRKSQLDVRNVARPSKWNLARLALAGPQSDEDGNLTEVQKLLKRVKGEYTTVTHKEDVLETIMNATAHASFECLGRFEMEPAYTTRTAINTSAMKGKTGEIYRICHHIGRKDLIDVPEEDASLVQEHGLKLFSAQAGEISHIGEEWMEGLDGSLGLALPAPRRPGKKATFTKALSGLMVAKNMKATGALAQATAGDLLPERAFLGRCGEWCLIGLVNCQGSPKVAGPLAVMIAQEMPKALFQSPSFVEKDPAAGLTEAFDKVHVLSAQDLDVTLTGASMTVLLMNEKEIWVAHVGDCRCVIGSRSKWQHAELPHLSNSSDAGPHFVAAQRVREGQGGRCRCAEARLGQDLPHLCGRLRLSQFSAHQGHWSPLRAYSGCHPQTQHQQVEPRGDASEELPLTGECRNLGDLLRIRCGELGQQDLPRPPGGGDVAGQRSLEPMAGP